MGDNLNERLMELVKNSIYTQKELAEKAGVTEAAMSHYLNGTRCPRPTVLAKLASLLNVSVDYLIYGDNNSSNEAYKQIRLLAARNVSKLTTEEKMEIIKILTNN